MTRLTANTLLLSLTLLGSGWAIAAETLEETRDVSGKSNVSIKVQRGDVNIKSWDRSEIQVKGTLDDLSEGLVFTVSGEQVTIEDTMPQSYKGKGQGSKLTIMLPSDSHIEAEGVSSDYRITEIGGLVSMQNVSGDVTVSKIGGGASLTTISGDIEATDIDSAMDLSTISGEIKVNGGERKLGLSTVSGEIEANTNATGIKLETVSGEVELKAPQLTQLMVNSVSGDVDIKTSGILEQAKLDSVSGDISINFDSAPNARFRINGGPGGRIDNQLTDDKPNKAKYTRQQSLQFTSGSGDGTVVINTISGKLAIN
ncbi:DUF4097 domain-containing protein [Shewanella submarina]|uniref:DUF4097 domain-containing protein n=1 Tax=Shewanella submarina TaxID=2016376 RepID=A0ABV7G9U4_9GAMM|nr:DUF4097 family beta strand repeat-containing protein [Shewanella submarina]MCL1039406.1 DUF4097 domain-containing protein [Shewanella submarina]